MDTRVTRREAASVVRRSWGRLHRRRRSGGGVVEGVPGRAGAGGGGSRGSAAGLDDVHGVRPRRRGQREAPGGVEAPGVVHERPHQQPQGPPTHKTHPNAKFWAAGHPNHCLSVGARDENRRITTGEQERGKRNGGPEPLCPSGAAGSGATGDRRPPWAGRARRRRFGSTGGRPWRRTCGWRRRPRATPRAAAPAPPPGTPGGGEAKRNRNPQVWAATGVTFFKMEGHRMCDGFCSRIG